jgi:hypothetical protein
MEIMAIHSWKSQYISAHIGYDLLCDLLEMLNFKNIGALLQLTET